MYRSVGVAMALLVFAAAGQASAVPFPVGIQLQVRWIGPGGAGPVTTLPTIPGVGIANLSFGTTPHITTLTIPGSIGAANLKVPTGGVLGPAVADTLITIHLGTFFGIGTPLSAITGTVTIASNAQIRFCAVASCPGGGGTAVPVPITPKTLTLVATTPFPTQPPLVSQFLIVQTTQAITCPSCSGQAFLEITEIFHFIPEPGTFVMTAAGLLVLAFSRRREGRVSKPIS